MKRYSFKHILFRNTDSQYMDIVVIS